MEVSPEELQNIDGADSLTMRAMKDISFGSIAGMISKVFEHPFDLTKVRLQSQVLDKNARFSGPLDCLTQTWRKEGIRGLYRGLPAPIVGAMTENASLFWAYAELQNAIRWSSNMPATQDLSLRQLAMAGAGAGSVTSFLLTPIELVKCKMQVQMLMIPSTSTAEATAVLSGSSASGAAPALPRTSGSPFHKLPGPIDVLKSIIRTNGLRGLWLGHTGTLIRETGGGAAWFASKEAVATLLLARRGVSSKDKKELRAWESAVSGACAGVSYNIALFPADTIKSAMQTEAELRPRANGAPGPTFLGVAREMWRAQGIKGLYAGCGITVARAVPSSALIFLIYDGLSRRLGQ
ncbi:mitochondrial carrier [Obba rivulosa]|uniref:Mitochondrial carrier n=1 Tax=Obba rivulosa TaxID=1052685 RepID=A0A8E2AW62_9APHY|nr:mitochondrial carrier [Obba rivulosa]